MAIGLGQIVRFKSQAITPVPPPVSLCPPFNHDTTFNGPLPVKFHFWLLPTPWFHCPCTLVPLNIFFTPHSQWHLANCEKPETSSYCTCSALIEDCRLPPYCYHLPQGFLLSCAPHPYDFFADNFSQTDDKTRLSPVMRVEAALALLLIKIHTICQIFCLAGRAGSTWELIYHRRTNKPVSIAFNTVTCKDFTVQCAVCVVCDTPLLCVQYSLVCSVQWCAIFTDVQAQVCIVCTVRQQIFNNAGILINIWWKN